MQKALTKAQFDSLLKKYKKEGVLTPSGIIKEAKNPKSPLHSLFEWNNNRAAQLYRLTQARSVIRRANINIEKPENKFVHIPNVKKGEGEYKSIKAVVKNIDEYDLALSEALKHLRAAKRAVDLLYRVAKTKTPDKVAIMAIAMKGMETAISAVQTLH